MRRHTIGLAVGAAALAGSALVASRRWRAWLSADDPWAPGVLALPQGEEQTVKTSDGAALAMTIVGEGSTVVLAHGWNNARGVWAAVARLLVASGHRVVLYDQRGHGQSTVGAEGITIPRLAADLKELLEHLDAVDVVLAGHSMGGMSIMALAAHYPAVVAERVAAIVLVATAADGQGGGALRNAVAVRASVSPVLARVLSGRAGPALMRNAVGASPRYAHLAAAASLFVATPAQVRRDSLVAMQTMDVRSGLAGLSVPVTVIIGSRDTVTPPRFGRQIAAEIPGATLVELVDKGHMLVLEAPDALADLIASARPASAQD